MTNISKLVKNIIFYTLIFLLAFLFLFPSIWMVFSSFKPQAQLAKDVTSWAALLPPFNIPIGDWFIPYKEVFARFNLFRGMGNSFFYAFVLLTLNLSITSMAAYALARFNFPLRKFWLTLIIFILIIPTETNIVPLFVIAHRLGLVNSVLGLLAPNIATAINIFLFRQFFLGIPKELEEAAVLDGASQLMIFFKVIMPLSKAIYATTAILTFILSWNDYIWPVLIFADNKKMPLQVILNVLNNTEPVYINQVLAGLTVATIPIMIIYAVFQRYIVEGVSHTGIK